MSATQMRRLRFDVIAAMVIVAAVNNCYFHFGLKYFAKWQIKIKQEEKQWILPKKYFPVFFTFSIPFIHIFVFIVLNAVCFERNG